MLDDVEERDSPVRIEMGQLLGLLAVDPFEKKLLHTLRGVGFMLGGKHE